MANITILQAPQKYTPAFNDQNWVVLSTNRTQANFKYVCDVVIADQVFRQSRYPHPTYGTGIFNVAEIVQAYVSASLNTNPGFQQNINQVINYTCQFGEEYGSFSTGTTVYSNQVSSGVVTWDASLDSREFVSYNQTTYVPNGSNVVQELTNRPSSGTIRDSENAWLSILNDYSSSSYFDRATVITYDSNGSIIQQVVFTNPFTTDSTSDKIIRFSSGTNNLNDIPSSGIISGSQPIITASVAKYYIRFYNSGLLALSYGEWYIIDNTCTRNDTFRFHFLNKLGGWDSFTFIRGNKKNLSIERSSYKKTNNIASATGYSYTNSEFSNVDYNTKGVEMYSALSDWLSEDTYNWLAELVMSPCVYLDDSTYGLLPVNIKNTTFDYKYQEQEKIFNLSLEFRISVDIYRQKR